MNNHYKKTIIRALSATVILVVISATTYQLMQSALLETINNELKQFPSAAISKFKKPTLHYQATNGEQLKAALNRLSTIAGVTFKINIDLNNHVVSQNIDSFSEEEALKALLGNYNYAFFQDGAVKTVIITRYNGSADHTAQTSEQVQHTLVITPVLQELPPKYQDFPQGSVTPVSLPINQIMAMSDGESTNLVLPIGQYAAIHDETRIDPHGNKIWMGHLSDPNRDFRIVLAEEVDGISGVVITPKGTFNFESEGPSTYFIDTNTLL